MKIGINKSQLGMTRHLIYDSETGETSLEESLSAADWTLGSSFCVKDAEDPLLMVGLEKPELFASRYKKAYEALGVKNPPWNMCIPKDQFRASIRNVLEYTQKGLETFEQTGYKQTHIMTKKVLQKLNTSLVDEAKIKQYALDEENPSVRNSLLSFLPDQGCHASPVVYTRQNTVTGRLTVKKGPSILTLASKHRDILKSRYQGGKIVQLDFRSLEPRVCRFVNGLESAQDIYQDINDTVLGGKYSRKVIKLAVICALYGASKSRLENVIGNKRSAVTVLEKVRSYFNAAELVSKIKKGYSRNKFMQNYYGRILSTDTFDSHVILSHYIQSTAVDVALLGFLNVLECVSEDVRPIFIVHDALILDCPKEHVSNIEKIAREGIDLDLGNFPASVTCLST